MSLATAYWCVLIAAALPYVWVAVAKGGARGYDNRVPRDWMARQSDPRRQRAYAAHANAFEAFAPFAAAVLMAQLAGVPHPTIGAWAVAFVGFRVLHGLLYVFDWHRSRSLAWLAGFACVFVLLVQAARHVA